MQAAISGIARKAVIVDGDSMRLYDVDRPGELIDCQRADIPYIFGEGLDLRFVADTDIEQVAAELKIESKLTIALDLTLISLDCEMEEDIRRDAILDLDQLVCDERVVNRLEGIMYARPLPADADLEKILAICKASEPKYSSRFFSDLARLQPVISEVSTAWDVVPTKVFGTDDQKTEFQRVAVQRGLFRSLVKLLDSGANLSGFMVMAGLDRSIQQLRNFREVLLQWSDPFRASIQARTTKQDLDDEIGMERVPRRKRGRLIGLNRPAILRRVNEKKNTISSAIKRRDFGAIPDLVNDLVAFQRTNGETEHLAKSLCDLALEAKNEELFVLQLQLTERSIGEVPDDAWSWAQYGDALLQLNRLPEARRAYEQAESFGSAAMGTTGHAEVLKAQRRWDESLELFNVVIAQHPESVVAKTGRAEVLKAQGKLDEALDAFDKVIAQHPESVVAKNGRAEVLKAQGKLDEALRAFDRVIAQHPESVVARTARAEVLKAQGELSAALTAYEEVIRLHPENVFAKDGRAEVLKAQGKLPAALAAYEEAIRLHPENVIAKNGRAEVLKAQGKLPAALAAYEEVIRLHPENEVAKTGRAEVLKVQGDLPAALAAYEKIVYERPENRVARTGRVTILATMGHYDEALTSLRELSPLTLDDWIDYHVLGMIKLRTGKVAEAMRIFTDGVQNSPWSSTRDYFLGALALTWLRGHDFKKAANTLEQVESPILQPAANVFRIHAFGAQGNIQRATLAYEDLRSSPKLQSRDITQELHHQFILRRTPRKDENWLIDKESEVLLLAA